MPHGCKEHVETAVISQWGGVWVMGVGVGGRVIFYKRMKFWSNPFSLSKVIES